MKKAAFLIAAMLSVLSQPLAGGEYISYALMPQSTVLYAAGGAEICTLPATYFAVICGSESDGKLPVSYLDLSGYVQASSVTAVDYEPVTKFHTATATVDNDGMAVNLRSIPDKSEGVVVATVPASATLTLYGSRVGSEFFAGAGNVWQYVKYVEPHGSAYYGYIHSAQLLFSPVPPNVIEKVVHEDNRTVDETPSSIETGKTGRIILIAAMCVPAGVIMLFLFYRPDSARTPRHRQER